MSVLLPPDVTGLLAFLKIHCVHEWGSSTDTLSNSCFVSAKDSACVHCMYKIMLSWEENSDMYALKYKWIVHGSIVAVKTHVRWCATVFNTKCNTYLISIKQSITVLPSRCLSRFIDHLQSIQSQVKTLC